ncbi:hypothetical protein T02_16470 [Trichinella nativa]|uniref:Uncharacterized protein n=1 Tax=Trichinella nativa TaxID=6335 RepID=A0A0V1LB71_9BILA|nr:hypothetical protein T02_16470 [Trichinella nativa]
MQQKQCCCDDAAYTNATEYYISPKLFELNVGRIEISKLHFTFKVLKKHCPAKQIRHRYDEQKQYFYTMAQDVFPRINLLFSLLLALLLIIRFLNIFSQRKLAKMRSSFTCHVTAVSTMLTQQLAVGWSLYDC